MKTINELQDEVIEEFSDFDDWMDKYQLLIDLGNEQEPLAPEYKNDQNLIDGCQSRVWLQADLVDGKVEFQAESDALIVKGIIALLIKVVSGHTPDEILENELYFIEAIGLKDHLSPTRSNGLLAMVKQMRMYALAFKHILSFRAKRSAAKNLGNIHECNTWMFPRFFEQSSHRTHFCKTNRLSGPMLKSKSAMLRFGKKPNFSLNT